MGALSNRPDNSQWLRRDYTDFLYQQAAGNIQMENLDYALQDAGISNLLSMLPSTATTQAFDQSNTVSLNQDTVTTNLLGANLARATYKNNDTIALTSGTVVYLSGTDTIARADKDITSTAMQAIGLVYQPSIAVGVYGQIVEAGLFKGVLTGATPNTLYYLGNAGAITTTTPNSGQTVVVGWAKNTTDLFVKITTLAALANVRDFRNFMFGASNFLWYAFPPFNGNQPAEWYQVFLNLGLEDDLGFQGGVNH